MFVFLYYRSIVLHAGNKNGFVEGAALAFSSNTKNPDYHGEMNQENFLRWFEDTTNIVSSQMKLVMFHVRIE
jgi:hypothetical protein